MILIYNVHCEEHNIPSVAYISDKTVGEDAIRAC